jgi:Sap-like sulfolipid-1-addressing protein
MLSLVINLSLLAFAGAFSPVLISVCILLLSTGRPLGNTVAYILGLVISLLVVGGLALVLFDEPILLSGPRRGIGPGLSITLGGLCLVVALRTYLHVPDPDAPPPKWLATIESIVPSRAFMFGLVLMATNLKILFIYTIGVAQILAAELGPVANLITILLFVVIIQIGVLVPLFVYLWNPQGAGAALKAMRDRLDQAYRWVMIVLFVALGCYLIVNGLTKV